MSDPTHKTSTDGDDFFRPANDASISNVPDGEEAWRLLDRVLDETATAEERQRLEQLVVANAAIARLCLRGVHFWCGLQLHTRHTNIASEIGLDTAELVTGGQGNLTETMIMPAIRDDGPGDLNVDDSMLERFLPDTSSRTAGQPASMRHPAWRWGAAAAVAVIATGLTWSLWPVQRQQLAVAPPKKVVEVPIDPSTQPAPPTVALQPAPTPIARPAATFSATAAAVLSDEATPLPGSALTPGRTFRLTAGAVEVTFQSGAVTVISAPSQFRVVDQNSLALENGSMAAHVPSSALGFRVLAPGLSVTDHGTNFGVRTLNGDSAAETAVFDGVVEALGTDTRKQPAGRPVRLTAGQAVRHDVLSPDPAPAPVPFTPAVYTRDIARVRVPLPLLNTGAAVAAGSPDPAWQIISVPDKPDWIPRPAVVLTKLPLGNRRTDTGLRWLSLGANSPPAAPGNYVFRTMVDLTGFDPAGIAISMQAEADNQIVEIRTQGTSTAVQKAAASKINTYLFDLSSLGWKSGVNPVEVVVHNDEEKGHVWGPTGLAVKWTGTACPIVHR